LPLTPTPLHDKIHKWVFDTRNRFKVLKHVAEKRGFELDRDTCSSTIDIEKPVFYKETRKFIVDGVVDICSAKHCGVTNDDNNGLVSIKSFSGREIKVVRNSVYRRIVYDCKPALLSVSGAIGQLRSYQRFLQYHRWYNNTKSERLSNPDLIILTIDVNDGFDELLASQNINIFHINPKEIKR
jgi:hypothetical protein